MWVLLFFTLKFTIMAIFTPSSVISEISGSVGSLTYSRNRWRPYVKNKTIPVQPDSPTQLDQRNYLETASIEYRNLSEIQRVAWETHANNFNIRNRLSLKRKISGFNLYCKQYIWYQRGLISAVGIPKPERAQPLFSNGAFNGDTSDPLVTWERSGSAGNYGYQIWMSENRLASTMSINSCTFKTVFEGMLSSTTPSVDVAAGYLAAWGQPLEDIAPDKIFTKIRAFDINTGQVTEISVPSIALF